MSQTQSLVANPWFFLRKRIRQLLTDLNLSSTEAGDGTEVLRALHAFPPGYSLVLLDFSTLGTTSPDLLQVIRGDARLNHLTVIILSEDLSPGLINEIFARGADGYLHPDFTKEELQAELARINK